MRMGSINWRWTPFFNLQIRVSEYSCSDKNSNISTHANHSRLSHICNCCNSAKPVSSNKQIRLHMTKTCTWKTKFTDIFDYSLQVTRIRGSASFSGARTVIVDGKEFSAKHILIATGGAPNKLGDIINPIPPSLALSRPSLMMYITCGLPFWWIGLSQIKLYAIRMYPPWLLILTREVHSTNFLTVYLLNYSCHNFSTWGHALFRLILSYLILSYLISKACPERIWW